MRKPKFVHDYIDRHGKPRFYFRKEGQKQIPLPGLPWSPAFMVAYELAASGQDPRSKKARAGLPGTLRALAISIDTCSTCFGSSFAMSCPASSSGSVISKTAAL